MLSKERRQAIARIVRESGAVTVKALSARLGVSASTVRRDLAHLEQEGVVVRSYGGAVAAEPHATPLPTAADGEKDRIGRAAAERIAAGATVFLGPGSTTLAVAHHLANRVDVAVITNDLDVAHFLFHNSPLTVIVVGGQVQRPDAALIGHIAEQTLSELRAEQAIIGVGGVSLTDGLTGEQLPAVSTVRAALDTVGEVVVVADSIKFDRAAPAFLAPLERVDVIITGRGAPPQMVWDLTELDIQVVQV